MNRFFIGPLTKKQLQRRCRTRDKYLAVQEIQDARYITFKEALKAYDHERKYGTYIHA